MWSRAVASGDWREDGTSGMCGTHDEGEEGGKRWKGGRERKEGARE